MCAMPVACLPAAAGLGTSVQVWVENWLAGLSCGAQDHYHLRICTSSDLSATCKMLPEALETLLPMDRMRVSLLVVLRALFMWTAYTSVAFTDVCACVSCSCMARSSINSEYAQSLVDPKRTLFDVNIERRRYSSDRLIGAVTSLLLQGHR